LATISLGQSFRVIKVSTSPPELGRASEPEARMLTKMILIGFIFPFKCGVNEHKEVEEDEEPELL
jgi:hypothetical protein